MCYFTASSCPPWWTGYNKSCYKLFDYNSGITWFHAAAKCMQIPGAHLLALESAEEAAFIHKMIYQLINNTQLIYMGKLNSQ